MDELGSLRIKDGGAKDMTGGFRSKVDIISRLNFKTIFLVVTEHLSSVYILHIRTWNAWDHLNQLKPHWLPQPQGQIMLKSSVT